MISCDFKNGTILKKANIHFGSVAVNFIVRFSKVSLTIYTVSPCETKSIIWRIPADRINLKYELEEKYVEFKLPVNTLKDALKPVKKGDPVGLEITQDDNGFKLSIQIGLITSNCDSSESMHLDLSDNNIINIKAFTPEHHRVFINCKEMEREITRFEKDSIRALAYRNALIVIGKSPGKHSVRTSNFGEMDEEEQEEAQDVISNNPDKCLILGQVAPVIKTFCKIYDSPMHVNEDSGVLEFVSFPSCYGQFKLQIKCQTN